MVASMWRQIQRWNSSWSLLGVSVRVFGLSLAMLSLLAVAGRIPLYLDTVTGWVLNIWLSGHATVVILLFGGGVRWAVLRWGGLTDRRS